MTFNNLVSSPSIFIGKRPIGFNILNFNKYISFGLTLVRT